MNAFIKSISRPILLSLAMMILCGLVFPLALTGVSQLLFPARANGSMIEVNGQVVGSELVGQDFTDPRFFKCRPSAVNYNTYTAEDMIPDTEGNTAYGGGPSSGSQNLAPSNTTLAERVSADIEAFLQANPQIRIEDIPTDLLTASGSGLDPHISPASALVQIPAIAAASGLDEATLQKIVETCTTPKLLGIFGEKTVNVLKANIEITKALAPANA